MGLAHQKINRNQICCSGLQRSLHNFHVNCVVRKITFKARLDSTSAYLVCTHDTFSKQILRKISASGQQYDTRAISFSTNSSSTCWWWARILLGHRTSIPICKTGFALWSESHTQLRFSNNETRSWKIKRHQCHMEHTRLSCPDSLMSGRFYIRTRSNTLSCPDSSMAYMQSQVDANSEYNCIY